MWMYSLVVIAATLFVREGFADVICYEDWGLGCFTNDPPYDNVNNLPSDPDVVNTRFGLYTQLNKDTFQTVSRYDPATLDNSNFDETKPSMFLIHGWTSDGGSAWVTGMKDELLIHGDYNVFSVDWEGGAGEFYPQSVANTQIVGAEIDELIKWIDSARGYSYNQVHLIGHSLGAHCSGHAGKYAGGAMARISGMDPAGPSFENEHVDVRLDPSDAQFVDVMHTDADSGLIGLGIYMRCGHVDFYPNGGNSMPGCITGSCSHSRAHEYYTESINSACKFTSYPCDSMDWPTCNSCTPYCNYMGYQAFDDNGDVLQYYLETNANSPFCQG